MAKLMKSILERFEEKFVVNEFNGCWDWTATKHPHGYGNFYMKDNNRMNFSHRVSFQLYKGEIPKGMVICHKCDNPSCVNPEHLFLGTQKDNILDAWTKNRARIPSPSRGYKNVRSKISKDNLISIKSMLFEGRTHRFIASQYGVSCSCITNISTGKTYNMRVS